MDQCDRCQHVRKAESLSQRLMPLRVDTTSEMSRVREEVLRRDQDTFVQEQALLSQLRSAGADYWPAKPVMSRYCGLQEQENRFAICEVKNKFQSDCADFLEGHAAIRKCSTCVGKRIPPGLKTMQQQLMGINRISFTSLDGSASNGGSFIESMVKDVPSNAFQERAHEVQLSAFSGTLPFQPKHLDWCSILSNRGRGYVVCGIENRAHDCLHWSPNALAKLTEWAAKKRRKSDPISALEEIENRAHQGDKDARYLLGWLYETGESFLVEGYAEPAQVERDPAMATDWFLKAAKKGHSEAQYVVGTQFYDGVRLKRSYRAAARWFEKAARDGHTLAAWRLGEMHCAGTGVRRSQEKGCHWLDVAAGLGSSAAAFRLATLLGASTDEDSRERAGKLMNMAAQDNNTEAQYMLGVFHLSGRGVQKDMEKARHWFDRAATRGHRRAQQELEDRNWN